MIPTHLIFSENVGFIYEFIRISSTATDANNTVSADYGFNLKEVYHHLFHCNIFASLKGMIMDISCSVNTSI